MPTSQTEFDWQVDTKQLAFLGNKSELLAASGLMMMISNASLLKAKPQLCTSTFNQTFTDCFLWLSIFLDSRSPAGKPEKKLINDSARIIHLHQVPVTLQAGLRICKILKKINEWRMTSKHLLIITRYTYFKSWKWIDFYAPIRPTAAGSTSLLITMHTKNTCMRSNDFFFNFLFLWLIQCRISWGFQAW